MCGTCGILWWVLSVCDMFGFYVFPRHCGRLKWGVCGVLRGICVCVCGVCLVRRPW